MERPQSAYNWLVGASPFLAAALVFAATTIAVTGTRWRYLLETVIGIAFWAFFGVSALEVFY